MKDVGIAAFTFDFQVKGNSFVRKFGRFELHIGMTLKSTALVPYSEHLVLIIYLLC